MFEINVFSSDCVKPFEITKNLGFINATERYSEKAFHGSFLNAASEGHDSCVKKLSSAATKMGANAIINLRFTAVRSEAGGYHTLYAYADAVIVSRQGDEVA